MYDSCWVSFLRVRWHLSSWESLEMGSTQSSSLQLIQWSIIMIDISLKLPSGKGCWFVWSFWEENRKCNLVTFEKNSLSRPSSRVADLVDMQARSSAVSRIAVCSHFSFMVCEAHGKHAQKTSDGCGLSATYFMRREGRLVIVKVTLANFLYCLRGDKSQTIELEKNQAE